MKGKKGKIRIIIFIIVASIILSLFLINNIYIYSSEIDVSFDPYIPPSEPSNPPSPSPSNPVENQKPVANITIPKQGYLNELVIMHGNYSYDPDGTITGYRWDFDNDGLFDADWSNNPFTTHIFNSTGNHTVKLQVKDNKESTDTEIEIIEIVELMPDKFKPVSENNGPYFAIEGENIYFNNSGSYDIDGNITYYLWEFGDGNTSNKSNPTHSYKKAGSYIITLTVKDNDGLTNQDFTTANIDKNKTVDKIDEETGSDRDTSILLLSLSSIFLATIIATIIALIFLKRNKNNGENQKSVSKKIKSKNKTKAKKKSSKKQSKKVNKKKTKPKKTNKNKVRKKKSSKKSKTKKNNKTKNKKKAGKKKRTKKSKKK